MIREVLVVLTVAALLAAVGCRTETDPPPSHIGEGKGTPIRVPAELKDKSIIVSVPEGEDAGMGFADDTGETEADAAPADIEIDDSTAEGVVQGYISLMAAKQLDRAPDLLVPEQEPVAREFLGAINGVIQAQAELDQALDANLPGHAIQLGGGGPAGNALDMAKRLTIVEVIVSPDNEDEATATVEDQATGETETLTVRRLDGRWRIEDPDLSAENLEQGRQMLGIFTAMAEGMRGVADRINNGEITDEKAAQEALGQAMKAAMGPVMGAMMGEMGEAVNEAAEAQPEPAEPEPEPAAQPRERERDAVDDTIAVPGILNRG